MGQVFHGGSLALRYRTMVVFHLSTCTYRTYRTYRRYLGTVGTSTVVPVPTVGTVPRYRRYGTVPTYGTTVPQYGTVPWRYSKAAQVTGVRTTVCPNKTRAMRR